jgi:hypothetical protein
MVLVGIVPGSCALGPGLIVGPGAGGGGLHDEVPSVGTLLAMLGGGPNLKTSWGCGSCWAEGGGHLPMLVQHLLGVLLVWCAERRNELPLSTP